VHIYYCLHFLHVTACNASRILVIVEVSVRPFVRHTLALYQNGKPGITKSLLWAAPRTIVLVPKFRALGDGVPLEQRRQSGVPLKRRYFAIIRSYSVKMVADRYRLAAYHNKH